jgi:hypothetical protein
VIEAGIDTELKPPATDAVRLFPEQAELRGGPPFPVDVPNAGTPAAMAEADGTSALERYGSFRKLREKTT